jgi:hypothetical protein
VSYGILQRVQKIIESDSGLLEDVAQGGPLHRTVRWHSDSGLLAAGLLLEPNVASALANNLESQSS